MLLVQDDYTPFFACMDAIVEKIEYLCLQGSIYFKFSVEINNMMSNEINLFSKYFRFTSETIYLYIIYDN